MELHGKSIIAGRPVASANARTFSAVAAVSGEKLPTLFSETTTAEADEAFKLAEQAFETYRALPADRIAAFLVRAAEEILKLGEDLLQRANQETALPEQRLIGECAR